MLAFLHLYDSLSRRRKCDLSRIGIRNPSGEDRGPCRMRKPLKTERNFDILHPDILLSTLSEITLELMG